MASSFKMDIWKSFSLQTNQCTACYLPKNKLYLFAWPDLPKFWKLDFFFFTLQKFTKPNFKILIFSLLPNLKIGKFWMLNKNQVTL